MTQLLKLFCRYALIEKKSQNNRGITLIEMLVAVVITGVLAAVAAPSIRFGKAPLKDSTNRLISNVKLLRSKALSQTSAYRIRPVEVDQLVIERAARCDSPADQWRRDAGFEDRDLQFRDGIGLARVTVDGNDITPANGEWDGPNDDDQTWEICFNPRGLTTENVVVTLGDITNRSNEDEPNQLQVFLGGTVQLENVEKIPPSAPADWTFQKTKI